MIDGVVPATGPAVGEIQRRELFGVKLGLDAMRALCDALGQPERTAPSIHVAGTNGKGSVAAMVAAALRRAGYHTGLHTSPHLVDLRERFAIDGEPVDAAALERAAGRVVAAERQLRDTGALAAPMTFFELVTATAFEVFREARVDAMVVEVGLGGRLDATNVLVPRVAVITSIDFDHMDRLGHSLERIAFEKAGIIKPGVPVVVGPVPRPAFEAIAAVARERGAPLVAASDGVETRPVVEADGRTRVALRTPCRDYGEVRLALRGVHQVENAVVATRALELLAESGLAVPADAIVAGLREARWEGRLDWRVLADGRRVLLDSAHNPAGARVLAAHLREVGGAPLPIVFGVSADKACEPMLQALAPVATRFVFTEASSRRARSADDLLALAAALDLGVPLSAAADPVAALDLAWSTGRQTCVTGSIFLVGDVLAHLRALGAVPA